MHHGDVDDPFDCLRAAREREAQRGREDAEIAALLHELDLGALVEGRHAGPPPPPVPELPVADAAPGLAPRAGRGGRQVGFRLGPALYADLEEAAPLHGVRPATLARVLTTRGVQAALAQRRREAG